MFCVYCGNKLPDDAKFCDMCGKSVGELIANPKNDIPIRESVQSKTTVVLEKKEAKPSAKEIKMGKIDFTSLWKKYKDRWKQCKENKFKGKKDIVWTICNVVIVLFVVVRLALCFSCNIDLNGICYKVEEGTDYAYAEDMFLIPRFNDELTIKKEVRIGFKTYEVKRVHLGHSSSFVKRIDLKGYDKVTLNLYAYPNLEVIQVTGSEYCRIQDGDTSKLKNIQIESNEIAGSLILRECMNLHTITILENNEYNATFELRGDFPRLESITSTIVPCGDFVAENLHDVTFKVSNKDVQEVLSHADGQYLSLYLNLPENTVWESTHTIEDLYGKWVYKQGNKEVLSIQFQENGYVRVSDSLGIIGADVLKYSEVDESTLLLKAETNNMYGNQVSFQMTYILLGDELEVYILGNKFELIREK